MNVDERIKELKATYTKENNKFSASRFYYKKIEREWPAEKQQKYLEFKNDFEKKLAILKSEK